MNRLTLIRVSVRRKTITTTTRPVMRSTNVRRKMTAKMNKHQKVLVRIRECIILAQCLIEDDCYRVREVEAANFWIEHGNRQTVAPIHLQQLFRQTASLA